MPSDNSNILKKIIKCGVNLEIIVILYPLEKIFKLKTCSILKIRSHYHWIQALVQRHMVQFLLISFACMLSHFSRVRLCATPWIAAYQAPPSMGFSKQEYWSGVPLPSPIYIYMYSHDWFSLLCGKKQQNTVKQLSSN